MNLYKNPNIDPSVYKEINPLDLPEPRPIMVAEYGPVYDDEKSQRDYEEWRKRTFKTV